MIKVAKLRWTAIVILVPFRLGWNPASSSEEGRESLSRRHLFTACSFYSFETVYMFCMFVRTGGYLSLASRSHSVVPLSSSVCLAVAEVLPP